MGELTEIFVSFCVPVLNVSDIRYHYDLAGGAMMDLGCYAVNLIRFLFGAIITPFIPSLPALVWSMHVYVCVAVRVGGLRSVEL